MTMEADIKRPGRWKDWLIMAVAVLIGIVAVVNSCRLSHLVKSERLAEIEKEKSNEGNTAQTR